MATKRRLIHFQTFDNFNQMKLSINDDNTQYTVGINGAVTSGTDVDVPYQAIAFIKDTEQIWTHGKLYNNTQIIDLGTITIQDNKFTFSNQENVTRIIARDPKQPMIFKYSVQSAGSFIQYCPVQISIDDSTFRYMWNDISNSVEFSMTFTYQGSEASLYRADAIFHDYSKNISDLNDKISSSETKIDSNTNNIEGLRTELDKLLAMDNIYAIDFASTNTILDDLPNDDDGDHNYETHGNGNLLVNPNGTSRTSTYVILYDSEYLNGITPVWTEFISNTQIKVSFISDKHDRILFISFYVNPTTNTAWGLQLKQGYEGKDTVILDLGTITENVEAKTFTCTGDIGHIRNSLNEFLGNYNGINAFAKYTSNGTPTYCPLQVQIPRPGYYTLSWQSSDYTYSLGITNSGSTYNGVLKLSSKVGTNLYLSGNTLSLRNSSNMALSSVTLPTTNNNIGYKIGQYDSSGQKKGWKITSSVKTKLWKAYLLQVYSNSNAGIPFNTTIQTFTDDKGVFTRSKLVNYGNKYSDVIVYENSDGYTTFWIGAKETYEQPIFRLFGDLPNQVSDADNKISAIEYVEKPTVFPNGYTQVEVYNYGVLNSPLSSGSEFIGTNIVYKWDSSDSAVTSALQNLGAALSYLQSGVITIMLRSNPRYGSTVNSILSGWKVFKNGVEEAFPVSLTQGQWYTIKITKFDTSNALVEITG